MKKRKLTALQLNKKSISTFANNAITGGDDSRSTGFTRLDACNTKDVIRCLTGDACPTVFGCPSFVNC
ncbi:hypothetical protein [Kordia sp.]|uniref:hypothetical protein n=1 Tax=Kordia sp. TaxID=1965332 RepID=UPI0025C36B42|nr:hypothetical protein [Kordia sp.]MCH2193364.1 hypothetical protein [Kordia sp.]